MTDEIKKLIKKYKIELHENENGIYFLSNLIFKKISFPVYITGSKKADDDDIIRNLKPWRENIKSSAELENRWKKYYKKVKELEAKGLLKEDAESENFFEMHKPYEKLMDEMIFFDDYYIEGEEGVFYASKYETRD